MLSRREMVRKLATGAAGATVAWAATTGRASATLRGRSTDERMRSGQNDGALGELQQGANDTASPQTAAVAAPPQLQAKASPPEPVAPPPPPWDLLRPLAAGSMVAHGWRIADLSSPESGACVLTLQNQRGRSYRVHVCRNDGRPQGLVYTNGLDLVVMNGGRGDMPTEEGFAQAVAELSHVLAANESSWRREPVSATLLPHAERIRRFRTDSEWKLR